MHYLRWISLLALALAMAMGCRTSTTRTGGGGGPGEPEFFAFTFEECWYDTDCFEYPDDLCYTVENLGIVTGMCTYECSDDWDCPSFSVCEDIDGPWVCYETCDFDFDCAPGFGCYYDPVADVDVCLVH